MRMTSEVKWPGGMSDLGERFVLPERRLVRFEDETLIVEVEVVVEKTRPVCESVTVRRQPGQSGVTQHDVRRLPVDRLFELAAVEQAQVRVPSPPGTVTLEPASDEEQEELREYLFRRRRTMTDELLGEVADVYRTAHQAGEPPTEAVREHFKIARSTAGRWVQEARKRGLLGKARTRQPGEDVSESEGDV